jgi:hypothetical protein
VKHEENIRTAYRRAIKRGGETNTPPPRGSALGSAAILAASQALPSAASKRNTVQFYR